MNENKKTPQIRFKGFTDDWEQRKLGDMMDITSVKRIHQSDWTESGIRFLRARDIVAEYKKEDIEDKLYISKEKYDEYSLISGKVQLNDLLVTGVGTIGIPYLIRNKEPIYFKDGNIIWFKNNNKINGKFLYYSFAGNKIQSYINEKSGVGTVGTYTIQSGKETPIMLTNSNEQRKIANFILNIDNLITLHQRKYDKLVNMKKSMLEKMFPKNSEKVPEIRFKGFTDDWEQRKLSDCTTFRRGSFPQPYGKAEWYDGNESMPFVQVADVGNDMKLVDETKQRISKVAQPMSVFIPKKSVIVTLQGTIGRVAITQYDAYLDRTILYFDSYKNPINKNFWSYIIKNKFLEEAKSAPGGTIKTITKEVLSNFDLKMPIEVEEQNKIGECFNQIDNLITLHQRKLEKLNSLKKSMLEKMFV